MFHIDGDNNAPAAAPAAAGGAAIDAANVGAIYAATVKLPDFWQNNPRSWFQHIEAQFQLRGITQDVTKYFHVVAALDASTTARCMARLEAPPAVGKYDALKAFLVDLFELSELEKADRLLSLKAGGPPSRGHADSMTTGVVTTTPGSGPRPSSVASLAVLGPREKPGPALINSCERWSGLQAVVRH